MTPARAWAFERSYDVLSFAFRVRSQVPTVGQAVDRLLAGFRSSAHGRTRTTYSILSLNESRPRFALHEGRRCMRRSHSPVLLLEQLLWRVNSRAVGSVTDHLAVHAAAASYTGRGVLMPAPPDGGKTTTVAGLVRAGFDYLTDEAALIDPETLEAHPYPRPLTMARRSAEAVFGTIPQRLERWRGVTLNFHPDELRRGSIGRPCRVHVVVFPRYARNGGTRVAPISRAEALEGLARNSFNLGSWGSNGFEVLARFVRDADCYSLTIGDLRMAVGLITSLVEANPKGSAVRLVPSS